MPRSYLVIHLLQCLINKVLEIGNCIMNTVLTLKNKLERTEVILDPLMPVKFEMGTGNISFVLKNTKENNIKLQTKIINLRFGVVLASANGLIEVKLHNETVAFVKQKEYYDPLNPLK